MEVNDVTDVPLSDAAGGKLVVHGDGLTRKEAKEMAKKLRDEGIYASLFPSKKHPRRQVVLSFKTP